MPADVITFGEAMLRLTPPGFRRLEQAQSFDAEVGGAELNTTVGLVRLRPAGGGGGPPPGHPPRPARAAAALGALRAAGAAGIRTSIDPNSRANLWSVAEARRWLELALPFCDVLITGGDLAGSVPDAEPLFGVPVADAATVA